MGRYRGGLGVVSLLATYSLESEAAIMVETYIFDS